MNAEQFNALYRPSLHIYVMDTIRKQHATKVEVTASTVYDALLSRAPALSAPLQSGLKRRIHHVLHDLERGGLINRERIPVKERNMHYNRITPCPDSTT